MSPGGDEAGGQAGVDAMRRTGAGDGPGTRGGSTVAPTVVGTVEVVTGEAVDVVDDTTGDLDVERPEPGDDDLRADLTGDLTGGDAPHAAGPGTRSAVTGAPFRPMERVDAGGLQELATRALSGEQGAVADLLTAVRRLVHRYCRAKLGRLPGADHAAEDAAQEVCIAVLTALPRYKDTGRPFEAFVYRIAANKVADAQRASYRAPVPTDDVPDAATSEPGPEQVALDAFDAETVGRLLDTLPPKLREILTLRVGAGMSAEETGRALDMTAGAVRVAQHRAMQKLRKTAFEDESLRVAP